MPARVVAAKRGLSSDVSSLSGEGLAGVAQADGGIVVLLVDAWAPQLESYRRAIAEHESQQSSAVTAMIPRNHDSGRTSSVIPPSTRTCKSCLR